MADQPQLLGPGGVDGLGGEDQLHRIGDAHDAGQALGAAEAGGDAQAHLRLSELGLFAGQTNVTGHGQLTAAAQGKAVDCGDDGLGEVLQLQKDLVAIAAEFLGLNGSKVLHLADVGPSHKGTARAGEDDHQHLVVGLHRIQGGVQIPQDLLVQGVERLGAVHGQYSDGSALFKGYKRHSENSSLYLVHGGAVRPLLSLIIQQNIRAGKGNRSQSHRQPSGGIG